jgi:hypothetical protein
MLEERCDVWDRYKRGEIICVTTNGYVKRNGEAVMGRGIARGAKNKFPGLAKRIGSSIRQHGPSVTFFDHQARVVIFPVKLEEGVSDGENVVAHYKETFPAGYRVPGWAMVADLGLIARSLISLDSLRLGMGWEKVYLPRPGCGAGELDWETQVKPLCEIYGDWLVVVTL